MSNSIKDILEKEIFTKTDIINAAMFACKIL